LRNYYLLSVIILVIAGCARPTSPTGGPPDKTPPEIVKTVPASGTTQFKKRVIEFHFSEYVERSTFSRSLSLAPNLGINYKLDWGRKSVKVILDKKPPDSTTFILSVGTNLSDMHGNKIGNPTKVALSTGPEIDDGKIVGQVLKAETGESEPGMKVLLYKTPIDLSEQAEYTTETDTGGYVAFPHLGPGTYKAFWLNDRNRNRKWESDQERAQPFPTEFVTLSADQSDSLGTLYVQSPDTSRPKLMGVGLFTRHRLRLRFSESVQLDSLREIRLLDSTMNEYGQVFPLYQPSDELYVIFAHSVQPLNPQDTYHVRMEGLTDPAGNALMPIENQSFTGSTQEDTVDQRFMKFESSSGIYYDQPMIVTYTKPIRESVIRDSLRIIEGQTRHKTWEKIDIKRNRMYIYPDTLWKKGVSYQIKTWDPVYQQYSEIDPPPIWHPENLGSIQVTASETSDSLQHRLVLESSEKRITRKETFTDSTTIEKLPPMRYRVRVFKDLNNDGKWNNGRVEPFRKPEPYFIRSNIPIQPGFTSDLQVKFPH